MTDETTTAPADHERASSGAYRGENRQIWDEPAVEKLTTMVKSKIDTGVIADHFGTTRSAIIGKAHRLGLVVGNPRSPRGQAKPRNQRTRTRISARPVQHAGIPAAEAPVLPAEPFNARAEASVPSETPRQLLDLLPGECKFPIGDPQEPGFHFCGSRGLSDASPYCGRHARISYQPRDISHKGPKRW